MTKGEFDLYILTQDIMSIEPSDGVDAVLTWMPEGFANSERVLDKVEESKKAAENNHSVLYEELSSFRPMSLSREDFRAVLGELQQCFFSNLERILKHGIDHLKGKGKKLCSFSYMTRGPIHRALCTDDAAAPYNALYAYFEIASTEESTVVSCKLDLDLGNEGDDTGKLALIDNIVHCCYAHRAVTKAKMQQMKREAFDDGDCDDDDEATAAKQKRRRMANDAEEDEDDNNNNKEEEEKE